jgi:hypothetical protein
VPDGNGWSKHELFVMESLADLKADIRVLEQNLQRNTDALHKHTEEEAVFWGEIRSAIAVNKAKQAGLISLISAVVAGAISVMWRKFFA